MMSEISSFDLCTFRGSLRNNQALYVEEMSESYKCATIRRTLNSLSSIFHLSRNPNPTRDPEVLLALKHMHRKIGRAQKQASPQTREYLYQMMKKCYNSVIGLSNKVLLQLGYESMRRRSEICQFRFEDLKKMPNNKYALLLRQIYPREHIRPLQPKGIEVLRI